MRIKGHGIDIIDLERVAKLVARGDDFIAGWFTVAEIEYLEGRKFRIEVVGGRIAAKEAVAKALGTGFSGDVSWQDIEVQTLPSGAPTILLSGGALNVAKSLGITEVLVSISHTASTAMASAIAVGE